MDTKIENMVIESTMLGINDRGLFDAWLMLSGDGSGVGFGGFCLDSPVKPNGKYSHREDLDGTVGEYVRAILDTVGVDTWEQLKGKYIRVESDGLGRPIKRIGNLMKDKWFDPVAFFAAREDGVE